MAYSKYSLEEVEVIIDTVEKWLKDEHKAHAPFNSELATEGIKRFKLGFELNIPAMKAAAHRAFLTIRVLKKNSAQHQNLLVEVFERDYTTKPYLEKESRQLSQLLVDALNS